MHTYAVAPEPPRGGMRQHAREAAIIGEEHQPFGIDIKPANRHHTRHAGRQVIEYRRAPFRVTLGGHKAALLVV